MSFQKFGTGPDQKVVADEKDTQGVRKVSGRKLEGEERQELLRKVLQENKDK